MSIAKKCDFCGAFYEHYSGRNGMSLERLNWNGSVNSTEKTFDLCKDCMNALEKFIEERIDENGRSL